MEMGEDMRLLCERKSWWRWENLRFGVLFKKICR
jgi:hypothetical protein